MSEPAQVSCWEINICNSKIFKYFTLQTSSCDVPSESAAQLSAKESAEEG